MRRALVLSFSLVLVALSGCGGKPKNGECSTSKDCEEQEGYGKICIEGRCQECGQDTDCQAGFVCKDMKCMPKAECEKDVDCPTGSTCQAGRCVVTAAKPECTGDADCGPGRGCEAGRCVDKAAAMTSSECDNLEPIYFDFDKATIRKDAGSILNHHAACLKQVAGTIGGNCDERGTAEYNLHLGQRRAEAAKKYLVNLGVPAKNLKTVSYGKERPICSEHSETCWQQNRNAQFAK